MSAEQEKQMERERIAQRVKELKDERERERKEMAEKIRKKEELKAKRLQEIQDEKKEKERAIRLEQLKKKKEMNRNEGNELEEQTGTDSLYDPRNDDDMKSNFSTFSAFGINMTKIEEKQKLKLQNKGSVN